MNAHIRQGEQQEKFGMSREGGSWGEQIVTIRISNTSDIRGWYLSDILDEVDVELVGWAGFDYSNTGTDESDYPQTEDESKVCEHGNRYWFGHECGLCMEEGE